MKTSRQVIRSITLVSFAACASAATDVTFIDGGYAEMCSSVAHNAEDPSQVQLTGSRMSIPPIEVCTLAIEDEATTPMNTAGSYNNRGVLLFEEGRLDEALSDFDNAIVTMETLAAAHINRGYTLVALKRWEESLASFDRGIALGAPDVPRAHFNRGIAHEELGHVREAYNDYKLASELSPEWEEPKRELARFTVR